MTKFQRLGLDVCELRSDECKDEASSHTEFTRMLGEHGIPGLASLVHPRRARVQCLPPRGPGRGFAIAFLAWTIAQMFYANLRIIAVPFAFGITFLRLTDDVDSAEGSDDGVRRPPIGRRSRATADSSAGGPSRTGGGSVRAGRPVSEPATATPAASSVRSDSVDLELRQLVQRHEHHRRMTRAAPSNRRACEPSRTVRTDTWVAFDHLDVNPNGSRNGRHGTVPPETATARGSSVVSHRVVVVGSGSAGRRHASAYGNGCPMLS